MATRCIILACKCTAFKPASLNVRLCESCEHSWVAHVLAKLTAHQFQLVSRMDVTGSIMSYDVASMILFGTHAIPVRMKILFDHLNAALMHSEIVQTLHSFGWTYQDYIRGYIAQDAFGQPRTRWVSCTQEEELVIVQQFLRFVETRSLAYNMLFSEPSANRAVIPSPLCLPPPPPPPVQPAQPSPSVLPPFFSLPSCLNADSRKPTGGAFTPFSELAKCQRTSSSIVGTDDKVTPIISEYRPDSPYSKETNSDKKARKCFSRVFDMSLLKRETNMSCKNKKRVLCTMCNKTFCDKGALKIHYSAVHLKEMHRCTIAGCNMWFSSRRSRNRHSANPNPRLHVTHSSKKLPEDARIVDDGSGRCLVDRASIPNAILYPPVVNQTGAESDSARPASAGSESESGKMKVHARLFSVPREDEESSDSERKEAVSTDEDGSLHDVSNTSKCEEIVIDEN